MPCLNYIRAYKYTRTGRRDERLLVLNLEFIPMISKGAISQTFDVNISQIVVNLDCDDGY